MHPEELQYGFLQVIHNPATLKSQQILDFSDRSGAETNPSTHLDLLSGSQGNRATSLCSCVHTCVSLFEWQTGDRPPILKL